MKSRTLSMEDVARVCGVSRQVVSAVLNPRPSAGRICFSAATRQRVVAAAQRLGYRVNRTASNAASLRHGMIGVLVRDVSDIPEANGLRAITHAARASSLQVTIELYNPERDEMPLFLRENRVDGLMVFSDLGAAVEKQIARLEIPTVCVNANMRGIVGTIDYDEKSAMRDAVAHFAARGKRGVGMITGPGGFWNQQRRAGLTSACRQHGLPAAVFFVVTEHMHSSDVYFHEEFARFLQANPSVDAVILQYDEVVPDFYRACADLGKRIPSDIAVLSMGRPMRQHVSPPVSRLRVADAGVWTGTRLLCEWLEGRRPSAKLRHRVVQYELVLRGST